jgi:hypothetical protein
MYELTKNINTVLHTDLNTGEIAYVKYPLINNPKYDSHNLPENVATTEKLKANYENFMYDLENEAKVKDTWTKENLRKKEAIKRSIYNLPLFHLTNSYSLTGSCNYDINDFEVTKAIDEILNIGLQSYEIVNSKGKNVRHNTNEADFQTDRHKLVYFTLGNIYMGGNNTSKQIVFVLNGSNLRNPKFVVQDHYIGSKFCPNVTHENYQQLNASSMLGQDYVDFVATGIATKVLNWENLNSEILLRDALDPKLIRVVLDTNNLPNDSLTDAYTNFVMEMNKHKSKIIKIPEQMVYMLQKYDKPIKPAPR